MALTGLPVNAIFIYKGFLSLYYKTESISMDIHDLDLWIIFQVFPEFCDVNIHASSIEIGIAAPDLFQRLLPWQQVI